MNEQDYGEYEQAMAWGEEQKYLASESAKAIADAEAQEEMMKKYQINRLRALFLKWLTEDSKTHDARRKEFNQAIFNPNDNSWSSGRQCFNDTDLEMVMEKFDKAVEELSRE